MSKFLHAAVDGDVKAIALPQVFSKNNQAKQWDVQ